MPITLEARTALITGASRGIGAALSEAFRAAGATLVTPSRAACDLASPDSVAAYLEGLSTPIDILVNCAGINRLGSLEELAPGDFEEVLQINLQAPLALAQALAPGMKARGWGRILNISSIWGRISKPRRLTYSAAKAGLEGLTRALAIELAPHGVLVNALAPGFVDTDLTRKNNPPQVLQEIVATIPMGRLAQPAEIAQMALFLCSEQNTYMTGQTVAVDGGFLCR